MSKVLLINPPFNIAKENYDSSISVGLLSIATYLDDKGVSVEIIDGVRQKNYFDLIKAKARDCDYAGISVMTMQIAKALDISRAIKENNPKCKIVWGGVHPTLFIQQTIVSPLIDIICIGEGEITFYEIVSGRNLSEIKGIAYIKDDQTIINPLRPLHNPALMPLFNWDLEPREILNNLYLVPSLTSRGCPHRCTFCIKFRNNKK